MICGIRWLVVLTVLSSMVLGGTATVSARSKIPAGSDNALKSILNRFTDAYYHKAPHHSAADVQILRTLHWNNEAALVATYKDVKPKQGCIGILWASVHYRVNHWEVTGFVTTPSCLSARDPFEVFWGVATGNMYDVHIIFGRALPQVRSLSIVRKQRVITVPVEHGSFLIVGSCKGVQVFVALDAHGHALARQKALGCYDPTG